MNVEVLECKHYCHQEQYVLGIEFLIKNTGDRDTWVTSIEASFTDREKIYNQLNYVQTCVVAAHASIKVRELFNFPNVPMKERYTFKLKLHHTHGVFHFKAESTKTDKVIGWSRQVIY